MPLASQTTLHEAALYLARTDATLSPIVEQYGIATFQPHTHYYQALVENIISQQLSVKAAAAIVKRFLDLFPGTGFPSPTDIVTLDIETYRTAGLSRQKATYIRDLADKVLTHVVAFEELPDKTNDQIIAELTQIKGVGVWTVHMFLMFCMGRLDVLPVGDLGIKNGIKKLYGFEEIPSPEAITHLSEINKWSPYQSVASWYIWRSLDNMPSIEEVI